jgi:eukaryotic-like serine/threonine-protein kinase
LFSEIEDVIAMMHDLQPEDPQLIGPYRLRGRLGTGGMGRVYLGLSPGGRPAAVKVIRADLAQDPEFRARFRREINVARKVSGLFTAPVIDADVDGEVPWLATAYVGGPSLADAVRDHGPLPVRSVLELAAGLAEGLSAIHAAGVVHRDLKPTNVLLAEDGPRVIDFGISRAVEASALTHTGLVVGSPGFMSPEQAEAREVGPPSDIFSLGAVLAFAATGQGPFGAGSTPALVYRVVHSPPQLDRVPAEVRPLVERCLAKDPAHRPTARDLLAGAAYPATGWLPEPVTRAFSLAAAPPTAAGDGSRPDASPTVTAAGQPALVPTAGQPALVPTAGQPALVPTAGQPALVPTAGPGRPGRPTGPRPWRSRWRPLAVAAVVAGLAGAAVTAGFTMTADSQPTRAAQSAQRDAGAPAQTVAPATSATSSAASSSSYSPAAAAPRTTPTTPAYVPPPSTPPPATMAPPTSMPPSPSESPSPSASSPYSTPPAPTTSSPTSTGG